MILLDIVMIVVGFALLVKGADFLVDGAASLAKKAGIPEIVVGLTVVAFGTSAPEAAVSISSAINGSNDLAIGNVVGSNILNILIILGVTSVIQTLRVKKTTAYIDIPIMIGVSVLLLALGLTVRSLGAGVGILFWAILIGFIVYLIILSRKTDEEPEGEIKDLKPWVIALCIIGGLAVLVIGSNIAVKGARGIAEAMHISERIIGLTIVALGTSLPELFTSVTAAKKGSADISIGNIVGSNIFNILFVLGTSCLVEPSVFSDDFIFDTVVSIGASVLLWIFVLPKKKLGKGAGITFLVLYAVYLAWIIAKPLIA